jgi:hypothetical protein
MLLLTLSLVLAVEPTAELKIAAPGLNTSGMEASVAAPLTDHLARAFKGVRVITPRDISVLLGLERQKQLLGCGEESSECMAELGNALGVQGVLVGDLVKLGKTMQINARIIDPLTGRQLAAASERVNTEEEIFDALSRVGEQLRFQFLTALGRPPGTAVATVSASGGGSRRFFPIPFAIGGASLVAGIACLVLSEGAWQRLTSIGATPRYTQMQAAAIANEGKVFQTAGATLVTVGVAAAVAGVGLLLFGSSGSSQPTATLGVSTNGAFVAGTF